MFCEALYLKESKKRENKKNVLLMKPKVPAQICIARDREGNRRPKK